MKAEMRQKAIVKFAHGAGPRQVAFELGITVDEATRVQADMSGQRAISSRRRSTPRRK